MPGHHGPGVTVQRVLVLEECVRSARRVRRARDLWLRLRVLASLWAHALDGYAQQEHLVFFNLCQWVCLQLVVRA